MELNVNTSKYYDKNNTESQNKALDALDKWFYSKSPVFTLKGRAGTGKTFILNQFLNTIRQSVCVTAPTHKAVRVVERSTGRKGKTLQSLHGLRPNVNLDDFNLKNPQFDALGQPTIMNYKLVVVDECSMINDGLHELNLKRALDFSVKILYVGDPNQLPPINERISPTFLIKDSFELLEVVRQEADNPLMPIFNLLVDDIKTQGYTFLQYLRKHPSQINSKGEGYQLVSYEDFSRLAIDCFKSDNFSKDLEYTRIAAWKNETVYKHNSSIRHALIQHFNSLDSENSDNSDIDIIDNNDVLVGYRTLMDEFNSPIIINSEDYTVKNNASRVTDLHYHSFAATLNARQTNIDTTISIVDHSKSSFMLYYEQLKRLYFNAYYCKGMERGKKWREFFAFKDTHLQLISIPIRFGDTSSAIATWVGKDIDYGFSLTTHKLQGSTINKMFIDLNDMMYYGNGNPVISDKRNPYTAELRNKIIYTALSRTKTFAYILFDFPNTKK